MSFEKFRLYMNFKLEKYTCADVMFQNKSKEILFKHSYICLPYMSFKNFSLHIESTQVVKIDMYSLVAIIRTRQ